MHAEHSCYWGFGSLAFVGDAAEVAAGPSLVHGQVLTGGDADLAVLTDCLAFIDAPLRH
jgi:hypothetical protein